MASSNPFTKRLLQARTRKGISQKELGIRLGIEPSSASSRMNHYEKGRHAPDYEVLKKMAEELDVPMAYFFCESEVTAELVCLISCLDEEKQKLLIDQLKEVGS